MKKKKLRGIFKLILLLFLLCVLGGMLFVGYKLIDKINKDDNNDSSEAEEVVEDIPKDEILPEIVLSGYETNFINVGSEYTEAGYSASDNVDGDITDKVEVISTVDNNTIGEYTITYKVKDSSDNEVSKVRKVNVIESSNHGIAVLMYHYFYDPDQGETGENGNWMNINLFEEQLQYLYDNNYYYPTWEELNDYLDGKIVLPRNSVVITSDDGHESFFRLAIPMVKKYDGKITGFIVGKWTEKETLLENPDGIYQSHTYDMHWPGCSGINHGGFFNCVDYDEGVNDLKKSIEHVGSNMAIAYPYGDVNENVLNITRDSGIQMGFTVKYGRVYPGMDKLQLPRVRVSDGNSLNYFIGGL